VIDETGVGRAVADLFDNAGLKPVRISITAGSEVTAQGTRRWHVSKTSLISTLDARLHTGELRFAASLHEASALAEELKDFRRHVSVAGRYSYEARVGKNDDLVFERGHRDVVRSAPAAAHGCFWILFQHGHQTCRLTIGANN
jgi:hypothetical protein